MDYAERKHQNLVDLVCEEERLNYQFVTKNLVYGNGKGKKIGEIDFLGYANGTYDIYEIKCNDTPLSREKAIKQLHRAREYLGFTNARLFYVTQQIRREEIK